MKRITLLALLLFSVIGVQSQVLNQSAGWPNATWTITGSYATAAAAFEANPTLTANFAFDDDDAASAHEDNIAAESPVIDLTAAHTAGERWIFGTAMYGYRYLDADVLRFEYWDAGSSTWVAWGGSIPGNNTTVTDNFCTITKTAYTTPALNISTFTATQLSGFRYRIYYNDSLAGTDWNYGFCFDSPRVYSQTPPACIAPNTLGANPVTSNSATLFWTEGGTATGWNIEYGITGFTQGTGTVVSGVTNPYVLGSLTPNTVYQFYVQADCGGSGTSTWSGPFSFTTLPVPPANDECATAVALTVNADLNCGVVTAGTNLGATASAQTDNVVGTPEDDVWYSFVATNSSHRVSLLNVVAASGTSVDMAIGVYNGTGGCAALVFQADSDPNTLNMSGLTIGATYLVRVYGWGTGTGSARTNFNICVGTLPAPTANDSCDSAVALTVNPDLNCGTVTAGTNVSATASPQADDVVGNPDDDVWFTFVATSAQHRVSLANVVAVIGTSTDMGIGVYNGTGGCLGLVFHADSDPNTLNLSGLTIGNTYYVRVYGFGATTASAQTTFNICVGTPPPPPVNDECTGAVALTVNPDLLCGTVTPGTVSSATASATEGTSCTGTEDDDVWFYFIATSTSHKIDLLNVTGTSTNLNHSLWTGPDCSTLTLVPGTCSDPNTSAPTGLTIGETYYLRVFSSVATAQDINFNVCIGATPPPPANDECDNAVALTVNADLNCGVVTAGTNVSSTASAQTDDVAGTPDDDVWFTFVATSAQHRISLTNVVAVIGTSVDMAIGVYDGSAGCAGLVYFATSDPNTLNLTGLTPGNTYTVRVYGFGVTTASAQANFNICVGTPPPPPANDACSSATAIAALPYTTTADATSATNNTGFVATCGTGMNDGVWYTLVGNGGDITVAVTSPTGWDPEIGVYTGSCGAFTCVGFIDAGASGGAETYTIVGSQLGVTYYVNVGQWSGTTDNAEGPFTLNVSTTLSTDGFDMAAFKAYPNPVKDVLNLSYTTDITAVEVYNMMGQQVLTKSINLPQGQVDMSNLSAGNYIVKISADQATKTIKVIKQ